MKESRRKNLTENTNQTSDKKDIMDEETQKIVHDLGKRLEGQVEIKELFGTLLDKLNI